MLVRPNNKSKCYVDFNMTEKTYDQKGRNMCVNDGYVEFYNSELYSGQLGKKTLGSNKGIYFLKI